MSAEQVMFIHARLIEETGGTYDVRDLDPSLAAMERLKASFVSQDL